VGDEVDEGVVHPLGHDRGILPRAAQTHVIVLGEGHAAQLADEGRAGRRHVRLDLASRLCLVFTLE
jgi:hypothetical protein